jgi:hypothetical protein
VTAEEQIPASPGDAGEVPPGEAVTPYLRLVPDDYPPEGDVVYARSLRPGEPDDGRGVTLAAGQRLGFKRGALVVYLELLDDQLVRESPDYAPLSHTVWSWLSLGAKHREGDPEVLYVMAAARRLDAAAAAWARVTGELEAVRALDVDQIDPTARARLFAIGADLELAVIALRRVIAMVEYAGANIGSSVAIPQLIEANSAHVKAIRDAFEHIDERALGRAGNAKPPEATGIFKQGRLISDGVVSYGPHEVSMATVTDLLASCRQFLKDSLVEIVGAEALEPSSLG